MFGINTAETFFEKVLEDWSIFENEIDHSGKAINSILSLYHLHEWVWVLKLNPNAPHSIQGTMIRTKSDWLEFLEKNCPYFNLLQELANGSKHCFPVHSTQEIKGYGRGPYNIGPYGKAYLLIDLGANHLPENRYLNLDSVLKKVILFWQNFLLIL